MTTVVGLMKTTLDDETKKTYDIFDSTKIYEFDIMTPYGVFVSYEQVVFDPEHMNYKIYSYYIDNGKLKPCLTTGNGKYFNIEFLKISDGKVIFKGPIFTGLPRKGEYDQWVLTKRSFDI